jgi:acyl carrier protein
LATPAKAAATFRVSAVRETGVILDSTSHRIVRCLRHLAARGEVPQRLATAPIDPGATLSQLGMHSLGRVLLLRAVESEFAVMLPDPQLWGVDTLGDLACAVRRVLQEPRR